MKTLIKKRKILLISLITLLALVVILNIIIISYQKNDKIDENTINQLTKYLEINSNYYDGLMQPLAEGLNTIEISKINNIELNKQIASYIITNLVPNVDYDYNNCPKCYKYFSKEDNIKFYNPKDVDNIYYSLFETELEKINQEDVTDVNTLYYNEEINMYYINVLNLNKKPSVVSKFKEYSYNKKELYLDYYYIQIEYDEENNRMWLLNFNNVYSDDELKYDDIFDENNQIVNQDIYDQYFNTIRYTFNYDKTKQQYILSEISVLN